MKVSEQIIQVLDELSKQFGVVIDWSSETIMPYLTELLQKFISYEISTSIMWLVVGLIICGIGVFCCFMLRTMDSYDDMYYPLTFLIVVCFGVGISMVLCQIHDIIACSTMPELKVFKEIRYLLQ